MQHCFLTQVPFFSLFKNELRMISADLCESKHQLLQKMAVTADRPASKQIEVQTLGNSKWEKMLFEVDFVNYFVHL